MMKFFSKRFSMNPIPQPLFSAMPDGLVTGPAAGTYYTLPTTTVRNISRPREICGSDTFAVRAAVMIALTEGGVIALALPAWVVARWWSAGGAQRAPSQGWMGGTARGIIHAHR